MTKKLLFMLATAGLILNVGGCTSKTSQDDNQVIENADVDKIEAEELSSPPADSSAPEDPSLQAALGESSLNTADGLDLDQTLDSTTETVTTTTETDIAAAPSLDENALTDIPQPSIADATTTTSDSSSLSLNEEPTPSIDVSSSTTETTVSETSSSVQASAQDTAAVTSTAKSSGSNELKKIALTAPYQGAGGWVNTVYVARPGEKLKDISQTIYGSDKSKELKKISENSFLKYRGPKAGEKIYYVSPNRPDDSAKTLFYYEDMGMVPETYVAKNGDNLKKVSKEILGYDKAWVEMWTSNPVESKGKLSEGDTLRYWKSASSINTGSVAQAAPNNSANLIDPAQAPAGGIADSNMQPQMNDMNTLPPPPSDAQLAANMPPPEDMNSFPPPPSGSELPPPPGSDMNTASLPPPPPPEDLAPPPPPPPMEAEQPVARKLPNQAEEEVASGGLDNDTMMSLGAVGVLTAALAFILIRRKKKKAADQAAMSETNVGT